MNMLHSEKQVHNIIQDCHKTHLDPAPPQAGPRRRRAAADLTGGGEGARNPSMPLARRAAHASLARVSAWGVFSASGVLASA